MDKIKIIPASSYPGRKASAGTVQQILAQIPRCELFIDAMAGSGFVASQVPKCNIVLNDIDEYSIKSIKCQGVQVFTGHYEIMCSKFDGPKSTVFYFDPPYLFETRSGSRRLYNYEWDELQHRMFLNVALSMKSTVMISHYPCELYNDTLKTWRRLDYSTMTRAGVRVESLYMNYPIPLLLQCPGVAGKDYIDRQRIKRKVARLVGKLSQLEAHERAVVLSSIIDHFDYLISPNN